MGVNTKRRALETYRAARCNGKPCVECKKNEQCMLYILFATTDCENLTGIEIVVELLEDHGFHVTDAREETATVTEYGHVIDANGTRPTGAILLRVVPVTPALI